MVAKGRTRGRGSRNSAAPTSVPGDQAAVPDQVENTDALPADVSVEGLAEEHQDAAEGGIEVEGAEAEYTGGASVVAVEAAEVEEGEMEVVEGAGEESVSFDMEPSIEHEEIDNYAEDHEVVGGMELTGDGADDDCAAVNVEGETDEGISDISWVEELWNKKKAAEMAKAENPRTKKNEPEARDFDLEAQDESKEQVASQQVQPEFPDEMKANSETKTAITEMDEDTNVAKTRKKASPASPVTLIKRNGCIPRAYFGPAFDEKCFQCCIRIYPVAYMDLAGPQFAPILQSADSVKIKHGSGGRSKQLELFCRKSQLILRNLMAVTHTINFVTIEIEIRKPIGWKKVTQQETTISVPTGFSLEELTTAKFTLRNSYFRKNLCQPIPSETNQSDKERSLFINNLPQRPGTILRHIFPLASKVALVKVSEDQSSAVLTMKSRKMVLDHLVAISDVSINGKMVQMGAVNMSQKDAQNLLLKLPSKKQLERKAAEKGESVGTSSAGKGTGDNQKKLSSEQGKKSQELRGKEGLGREKKGREQERSQKQKERVQKDQVEKGKSKQHTGKSPKGEPGRFSRNETQEARGKQKSRKPRRSEGMPPQMRHEMDMLHEIGLHRSMDFEREMARQREMQRELEMEIGWEIEERERRAQEMWKLQEREREERERIWKEEERERCHQENLLRERGKLEKMHQEAVLKLMMVEEQQRRERDELNRREHEMEMERKHMQQQLEEERRRQQQEKEEWERMSRKRGRFEEPGPDHVGMASKRGRAHEGQWEDFSGAGNDQMGKHLGLAAGPSGEASAKRKLELEVARQAEELQKSLALLDEIKKDPYMASTPFGGQGKDHRDQPLAAFDRAQQDDRGDMSHFQHSRRGAAEADNWLPPSDLRTSQPARQWRNSQREGQSSGSQGGQQRRGQSGKGGSTQGQGGQRKGGGYQQPGWQSAESARLAREGGYDQSGWRGGGGYASFAQQNQGSSGDSQGRWIGGGGGYHGVQSQAGNY